jgi:hypothetical protein
MQTCNIFDLTARDSAQAGLPHSDLLILAFTAIVDKKLPARFGADLPKAGPITWLGLVRQAISALKGKPSYFARWFRLVMVDVNDYREWRCTRTKQSPADQPRRPRANLKSVLGVMKGYIEDERKNGRHSSQKRAWEYAKTKIPSARHAQVIDALRNIEGRKGRGRPRSSPRH